MRAQTGYAAALGSLLLTVAGPGCEAQNLGEPPPDDRFVFPSGVLLDPVTRVEPIVACAGLGELAPSEVALPPESLELSGPRYLYVANGNNDRTYSAGSVVAVDLREFWRAWYDPHLDDPAQATCLAALAQARAAGGAIDEPLLTAACEACADRDPLRGGLDPYCHEGDDAAHGRCVLPPGSDIPESGSTLAPHPCRRLPLVPHVVECDERSFVASSVRVGDFATTLAASIEDDGRARLWLPVRGDPSVTYIDVDPGNGDGLLQCGQGDDPLDPKLCGDDHRLDSLRNDPELESLGREPYNTLVWEHATPSADPRARGERLAFVAHSDGPELDVIDLDGVRGGSTPAIVDLAPLYAFGGGSAGGFGLAARPCFEAGRGPLGASDPRPNVPSVTQGCSRPLVYTSLRFAGQLISFTASGLDVGRVVEERLAPASERVDCSVDGLRTECRVEGTGSDDSQLVCHRRFDRAKCCPPDLQDIPDGPSAAEQCDMLPADQIRCCEGSYPSEDPEERLACATDCSDPSQCGSTYGGPYCASPEQIGQPCAIECEPKVRGSRRIQPSLLFDTLLQSSPILGDMAFADPRGDQLLIVETNPGALLSLDTSLSDDGEPLDIPSAPPVEICAEPSRMKIHTEYDAAGVPVQRYALITCFRAALVYVVDLESLRVVEAIVVGTGPHDLAIDAEREVAYVINNLEFSISVIDLSRRRSTRFQEMARIGLQDPFSQ